MPHRFRFLEDIAIADIAFLAEGDSAEDLFRGATQALVEIMADPKTVGSSWERRILKTDGSLDDLLIEWLSEIVYWKDAAGVVFRDAPLTLRWNDPQWTIDAVLIGEAVDRNRQELRNDVKGITRHLYELRQEGPRWTARLVLDV
jgi:SHS2 domain-containing protein